MDNAKDPAVAVASFIAIVVAMVAFAVNVTGGAIDKALPITWVGALMVALICPRDVWRWAILVVLAVPCSYAVTQPVVVGTSEALMALALPLLAAYCGYAIRTLVSAIPRMSRQRSRVGSGRRLGRIGKAPRAA